MARLGWRWIRFRLRLGGIRPLSWVQIDLRVRSEAWALLLFNLDARGIMRLGIRLIGDTLWTS